ncbi:Vacuolar protein sorting-associated protein 70 [Marasmius tenuissimus]|uniref:Vacuolar protein sorting-associated protein 70 n=1 Tax=Marasmius tenuissimus TaxID=585030 RepID=A0ABR2ZQ46_9AGAR
MDRYLLSRTRCSTLGEVWISWTTKGKSVWKADLDEDGDPLDEDAHKYRDFVPGWHGFSSDGEAEGQKYDDRTSNEVLTFNSSFGQVIYANYGTKEDKSLHMVVDQDHTEYQ